ncbi:MAG: hypothetical protein RIQ68_1660 [Pseudomonadota bacterium]|jgi:CheY-like chemotaxis protein
MDNGQYPELLGRRILIVEDEPMIAMTLEDMLGDAGCRVAGTASQIADALQLIAGGGIDGAVLDVNLGAEKIGPVADELARLGSPFIFTTGYGAPGVPHAHAGQQIVQKPFRSEDLAQALARAFLARP